MDFKYSLIPQIRTITKEANDENTLFLYKFKYKHVWQSVRLKLKFRFIVNSLLRAAIIGVPKHKPNVLTIEFSSGSSSGHQRHTPTLILHPDSFYLDYWNLFISLTTLYTAIIMPYLVAFPPAISINIVEQLDKIFTSIYAFDFLINLITAYYNKKGKLITRITKIFKFYFKSWMLIDILSFFPFDILLESKKNVPVIFKLAKLLKIVKVINWIKVTNRYAVILKLQDCFDMRHSVIQYYVMIFMICLCVHIVACLWCFAASSENNELGSWVFTAGLVNEDSATLYVTGLYWAVTTFSTVGYGDIIAGTNEEMIISICWMAFSTVLLGLVIGTFNNIYAKIDTLDRILLDKLSVIDQFSVESRTGKVLRNKLRASIHHSSTLAGFNFVEKSTILNELPSSLRVEVALGMYHGAARYLRFFQNKDQAVISGIIPFLVPSFVTDGNFVYKLSDFADDVHFIVKGRVLYLAENDLAVYTTKKRDYFGDIEFFLKVPRLFAAVARQNTELLSLSHAAGKRIKKNYPLAWVELKYVAKERDKVMKINKERMEDLKAFNEKHKEGEVEIKNFQVFHRNRRDMENTIKIDVRDLKKEIGVYDVYEIVGRIEKKLAAIREKVRIQKESFKMEDVS